MRGRERNSGAGFGFRNFGRGGGFKRRGRGKASTFAPGHRFPQYQSRENVMLEAGRLAAEYLAAKGVLPEKYLQLHSELGRSRPWRRGYEEEEGNWKGRGGKRQYANGLYNFQGREDGKSRYSEDFDWKIRPSEGELVAGKADMDDSNCDISEPGILPKEEISLPSKIESNIEADSDRSMEDYEEKTEQTVEAGKDVNMDLESREEENVKDDVDGVEGVAVQTSLTAEDKEAESHCEAGTNLRSFRGFANVPTRPQSLIPSQSLGTDEEIKETDEEVKDNPEEIHVHSPKKDPVSENSPCSKTSESITLNDSSDEIARSASPPKISFFSNKHQERSQIEQNIQLPTKIVNELSKELPRRDEFPTDVVNSIDLLEKEKQINSRSFKTCDLNLMGSSDGPSSSAPSGCNPHSDVANVEDSPVQVIASESLKTE